jgi:hypothetical protein
MKTITPILEKPSQENNKPLVCFNESNTIVCGKIEQFDYEKLENNITIEPFFGETDLFGF